MVSLSARRAWIEISPLMWPWSPLNVALRKESVDRNINLDLFRSRFLLSLSARRAWIEIIHTAPKGSDNAVALRKESVDRNRKPATRRNNKNSRSPQGERG